MRTLPTPIPATTLPHLPEQPGLRGHSHDPENDLLKRYIYEKEVVTPKHRYWVALASYETAAEARRRWIEDDGNKKIGDRTEYRWRKQEV